ncbi:MAG: ABC transporter substrate-binding protein [Chloroflexota bacterium]
MEGDYVSFPGPDSKSTPSAQKYVAAYKAAYHSDPIGFDAGAYDGMNIVLDAIKSVAQQKGVAGVTRAAVNDVIGATKGYQGALGSITFDAKGDWVGAPMFIYEVKGGKFAQVKEVVSKKS